MAVKIEIREGTALVEREVDGGRETWETPLPAVVSAQKGLNEPRYASLKGIMAAKKKPVQTLDAAALGLDAAAVGNHDLDWGTDSLAARMRGAGYPWLVANVFDSVSVALDSNTVLVKGLLDLSRLPHDFLGPFSGSFNGREPVEAGGPLLTGSGGTLRWLPDRLRIRDFPIPKKGIPALLRSLHVEAAQGGVTLPGVTGVGDVRVTAERVRLYRLERR